MTGAAAFKPDESTKYREALDSDDASNLSRQVNETLRNQFCDNRTQQLSNASNQLIHRNVLINDNGFDLPTTIRNDPVGYP